MLYGSQAAFIRSPLASASHCLKKTVFSTEDVTLIIKLSIKTPLQEHESHYAHKISVTEIV